MRLLATPAAHSVPQRDERRRYSRFAVRCRCWLESEHATVFGPTADVGLGGLFLRTAVPLTQGERVNILLSMSGVSAPLRAEGLVTRAVPAHLGKRHGIGVAFVRILDGREPFKRFLGDGES